MISLEWESPHIAVLSLDRPEMRNALDFAAFDEMILHLDELSKSGVRVLIVTGTGKSFCSGADLKEIASFSPERARELSLAGHRAFDRLADFPRPVLAMVNGHALGGGCELLLACDLAYAADTAKFGLPEAKVGMITGWGGTFRLAERIGPAKAKELYFTAGIVDAAEAAALGLVDSVFPSDTLRKEVLDIAGKIAANAPEAIRLEKMLMNANRLGRAGDAGRAAARRDDAEALFRCVETEDQAEGVAAFLEKRGPVFTGR